jgi:AcrR family transcriptional regulator
VAKTAQRLPRAQRREQLLDVTKRIVGEHGLHAVSIERVAREAGITRPVVYEHFADLSGLLEALLEREGERALTQLASFVPQPTGTTEPLLDVLLTGLAGYLAAVRSDPVTWRLILLPPEGAPEFLRHRVERGRAAVISQLAELIAPAYQPPGGQTNPDPELTASSMSALSDHWARLMLTEPMRFAPERILEHARWALSRFEP